MKGMSSILLVQAHFTPHASSQEIRNHRILEKSQLEQISGDRLVQPPAESRALDGLTRVPSS